MAENSLAWTTVWKHCILRSVLHHLRADILTGAAQAAGTSTADTWNAQLMHRRLKEQKDAVDRLLSDVSIYPLRPFQYYAELGPRLDARPSELSTIRQELRLLESLLQMSRRDVYVFLDNLDDYYERNPHLWFNSMYGQFRAVREISLAHPHIHLFTSIRQDVYAQFADEMKAVCLEIKQNIVNIELEAEPHGLLDVATLLDVFEAEQDRDTVKALFGSWYALRQNLLQVLEHGSLKDIAPFFDTLRQRNRQFFELVTRRHYQLASQQTDW